MGLGSEGSLVHHCAGESPVAPAVPMATPQEAHAGTSLAKPASADPQPALQPVGDGDAMDTDPLVQK